jgi:hypothetical protein
MSGYEIDAHGERFIIYGAQAATAAQQTIVAAATNGILRNTRSSAGACVPARHAVFPPRSCAAHRACRSRAPEQPAASDRGNSTRRKRKGPSAHARPTLSPPSPPLLVSMPRNVPACRRGDATSSGNSSAATMRGASRGLQIVFDAEAARLLTSWRWASSSRRARSTCRALTSLRRREGCRARRGWVRGMNEQVG